VVALYAVRDIEHRRAVHVMESQRFESEAPLRASAFPYYWNIFHWSGVAETRSSFAVSDINSRTQEFNPSELEIVPKPPETAATLAAKKSYLGRVYLDWAKYPMVTESQSGDDIAVSFRDLRFDYGRFKGKTPLSCTVELDKNLRVVREAVGTRQQIPPLD